MMQATKFIVSVKIEVLSMDSALNLLIKTSEQISNECPKGQLSFEDGDCIEWDTQSSQVEF